MRKISWFFLASLLSLLLGPLALRVRTANIYYVDFVGGSDANTGTQISPWKHVKGMTGCTGNCSSASIVNGDRVNFKGGVTWTASFPWAIVGGSSAMITYGTDHSWFTGGSFTQPTFDRGGGGQMATGTAWITIDDQHIVNCGTTMTFNTTKCLEFDDGHDLAFTNSTWATETWIGVYVPNNTGGSRSNVTYSGNDCSHVSGCIWVANGTAGSNLHNVILANNVIHDLASQIGGGVHCDGLAHLYGAPTGDATQYIDGIQIYNNRYYGDFRRSYGSDGACTGEIYLEGSMTGYMYNNDFSYSPATASMFEALIDIRSADNTHSMNLQIYNNSAAAIGVNAMSAGFQLERMGASTTVIFKNNIISAPQYAAYLVAAGDEAALVADYNQYEASSGTLFGPSGTLSWSAWQGLGYDAHGSGPSAGPSWVSAPGNEHLQSGSSARNTGTNLSSLGITLLNSDREGSARPGGATAWDRGAYQFGVNAPTVTTTAASSISDVGASSGGNVTLDGGASVTGRGVCWATSANPTILDTCTSNGTGTGAFSSLLTGLSASTPYHYRAYATNSVGTAYGSDLTFSTITTPTVTTTSATSITNTTAVSGGNVTSDGGGTVSARGVAWSLSSNPTISDSHTSDGTGTGVYASSITGLSQGTLYHYRAYATDLAGTAYGADQTFTTTSSTSGGRAISGSVTMSGKVN